MSDSNNVMFTCLSCIITYGDYRYGLLCSKDIRYMRLSDLHVFLLVTNSGSLNQAAQKQGITTSAISKILNRLETQMGLPLFERTARGVALTRDGEVLLSRIRQVIISAEELQQAVQDQTHARSGVLRLGSIPMLLPTLISPLLGVFTKNRPLASFKIELGLSAQLVNMVQQGELDFAIAASPSQCPPDVESTRLGPLIMQIATRSSHPKLHLLRRIQDLKDERWVLPPPDQYLRKWLELRFAEAGLSPPLIAVESTSNSAGLVELLKNTDFLSLWPKKVLEWPTNSFLMALEGEDMLWQRDISLFHRKSSYMSRLALDFCENLIDYSAKIGF